jgi:hypothetical protein
MEQGTTTTRTLLTEQHVSLGLFPFPSFMFGSLYASLRFCRIISRADPTNHNTTAQDESLQTQTQDQQARSSSPRRAHAPADVICGRGSGVASWPGNVEFRYICWKVKATYISAHRSAKAVIAQQINDEIASMDPPGRFVKLVEGTEVVDGRYANTAVRA